MVHTHNRGLTMTKYPLGEFLAENMPQIHLMGRLIVQEYEQGMPDINIWCRGSSGAIVSALIANEYMAEGGKARVCHVKKQGEQAHSHYPSWTPGAINIIADDFVSSGATVMEVYDSMQRFTSGARMDLMIVTSTCDGMVEFFTGKLRKIISY